MSALHITFLTVSIYYQGFPQFCPPTSQKFAHFPLSGKIPPSRLPPTKDVIIAPLQFLF